MPYNLLLLTLKSVKAEKIALADYADTQKLLAYVIVSPKIFQKFVKKVTFVPLSYL